ncbi:DNA (cytosine-5)-methyltransferase 1 [Aquabacterium commune]|uniref:Cytosine-specific methyltransferase n=2 Tax=Aquabacterium commune TaxID=70586 RepID=A0A4R6QYH5_9BURK|nr:DNA cytosine methyltransferase [Aquabacterium commune]TDP78155.1 DNA (cytosine-5)-methyltransferase 1 [Aquabacterium commune]
MMQMTNPKKKSVACIDLFCGAGGLTHGLVREGIPVVAGIDLDPACRYPYVQNNAAQFIEADVASVSAEKVATLFGQVDVKVLAGCAPCQPFSTYSQRYDAERDGKWGLLYEFARLTEETKPHIVTMENVPSVARHRVFKDFVSKLESLGYHVWHDVVDCSRYGVPQARRRMVLLASKLGDISLAPPTHSEPMTVREAIKVLTPIQAGQTCKKDPLHSAASLSELNMKRMKASKPGGTWRDWPKSLVADCHKQSTGKTFPSVYGRMEWDKPAPTMTTQCYGFGNGRFGHPSQNRAISLREAAVLQSFPPDYKFLPDGGDVNFSALGRLIGNAVPVGLGRAIGLSIKNHLVQH